MSTDSSAAESGPASVAAAAASPALAATPAAAAPSPLLQPASRSPTLAPIKVLAPLSSSAASAQASDSGAAVAASPSADADGASSATAPPVMVLDSDDVDSVALAKGEHLLHQRWTFWYDLKDSKPTASNWGLSLKRLMDFESIEQFWGMLNNIAKPSALPVGSDYHLFKYGVKPEWEDPENRNGGKWTWELRKNEEQELDRAWLNTMLSIIGENFTDENQVNGVVVSLRKGRFRIGLWTRSDGDKIAPRIGAEWKKLLGLPAAVKIGFQSHSQAMKQQKGGYALDLYTV